MPHPSRLVEITCAVCSKSKKIPLSQWKRCKSGVFCCNKRCKGDLMETKVTKNCDFCGIEIKIEKYRFDKFNYHFCSIKCNGEFNKTRIKINCSQCGKEIETHPCKLQMYNFHFCNGRCYGDWRRDNLFGENSGAWLGGISFLPYPFIFNKKLKLKIKERDEFECCFCKKQFQSKDLCVHHIDYDKLNNNENNLISLCRICHGKTNFNRGEWTALFTSLILSILHTKTKNRNSSRRKF